MRYFGARYGDDYRRRTLVVRARPILWDPLPYRSLLRKHGVRDATVRDALAPHRIGRIGNFFDVRQKLIVLTDAEAQELGEGWVRLQKRLRCRYGPIHLLSFSRAAFDPGRSQALLFYAAGLGAGVVVLSKSSGGSWVVRYHTTLWML